LLLLWLQGRQVKRTRYRRPAWHGRDTAVLAASALTLITVLAARLAAPETLYYNPYPPAALLPPFNPLVGAALLLLALPALLAPRGTEEPVAKREYAS
jgi:hypothetical protein